MAIILSSSSQSGSGILVKMSHYLYANLLSVPSGLGIAQGLCPPPVSRHVSPSWILIPMLSFSNSPEFDSACNSTFSHCLALTQHAYGGVFPYQLCAAADHLHHLLTAVQPNPLIARWLPSPPTRLQVDSALRALNREDSDREDETLGPTRFKRWAVELFAEAVAKNVGREVMFRVPVGIAGIAGIGAVTGSGKDLVGTVVAVYALGVATSIYLSLSG